MNMMPLTHHEQGRHAELFFPVLMMNCADWAIQFLLGPMAHIFYVARQDLRYNFWSRVDIFFLKENCSQFTQIDNTKSKIK